MKLEKNATDIEYKQIEGNVRMIGKMVNEKEIYVRKKEMKMKRKEKKGKKI